MESTTDSADQMAEGLGVSLREAVDGGAEREPDASTEPEADGAVDPEVGTAEVDAQAADDVETVVQTPPTQRATRKSVNGAAAAARKQASSKAKALADEVAELKRQLAEAVSAGTLAKPTTQVAVPAVEPVKAETIPDTHPELAPALKALADLGPKPKQGDYADFDEFEEARDAWVEKKARLGARVDFVREDVARRETIALEQANRDFLDRAARHEESVRRAAARHEDYKDAMDRATEQGLDLPVELKEALMDSPEGGEVLYHLVNNPADVSRLNQLPRNRALAELGIIEGRVTAALKRQPQGQQPASQQRTAGRVSRAPEPQGTSLGDAPAVYSETSLDDPNLSLAEYNRRRDAMDVRSGRRRPS